MASKTLPAWMLDLDPHVAACSAAAEAAAQAKADAEAAAQGVGSLRNEAIAARDDALNAKGASSGYKTEAAASAATAAEKAAAARLDRERAEAVAALVSGARTLARAPVHFIEVTRGVVGDTGYGWEMPSDARPTGDWELHMLVCPGAAPLLTHAFLGGPTMTTILDNWRIGPGDYTGDSLDLVSYSNGGISAVFTLATFRRAEWQWISIRRAGNTVAAAVDGVDGAAPRDLHQVFTDLSTFTPAHLFCGYGGKYVWEGLAAGALLTEPLTVAERTALAAGVSPPPAKILARWAPETLAVRGAQRRWCDAIGGRDLINPQSNLALTSYGYGSGGPAAARPYAVVIPATAMPAAAGGVPGESFVHIAAPEGARFAAGDLVVVQITSGANLGAGVLLDAASTYCDATGLHLRLLNVGTGATTSTSVTASALHLIV